MAEASDSDLNASLELKREWKRTKKGMSFVLFFVDDESNGSRDVELKLSLYSLPPRAPG